MYIPPTYYITIYMYLFFPRSLLLTVFFRVLQFLSTMKEKLLEKKDIEPHGRRHANFQKEKVLRPTNCWSSSHKAFSPVLTNRMLQNCFRLCRKRPELVLRISSLLATTNQCRTVSQRERNQPGSNPGEFSLLFPRQIKGSAHYSWCPHT